jgi:hypothetical protein
VRALLILAVLWPITSYAAPLDPLIGAFDSCFAGSAERQFLENIAAEPSMVAELAFQACATEETAIYSYLILGGMPPANARAAVVARKMRLKQKIRGF